jgi:hypothetical protein
MLPIAESGGDAEGKEKMETLPVRRQRPPARLRSWRYATEAEPSRPPHVVQIQGPIEGDTLAKSTKRRAATKRLKYQR